MDELKTLRLIDSLGLAGAQTLGSFYRRAPLPWDYAPERLILIVPQELCNLGLLLFPQRLDHVKFFIVILSPRLLFLEYAFEGSFIHPNPEMRGVVLAILLEELADLG